ncbi:molybdopterin molybdotransferase [Franzmannia pantelleriensis]|uniref:Molybdopterin molybdenumtransferase n=1 Tax=Franzmannia pantelleriensis TaxID=48727 RepID=A0A1G9M8S1_9GAMM|nr:gephyrin-like molybdotransferase Glp [Halomonas pantelleriensis]SDL70646.1 molybdopterin molybdotransferase [Halomonas pantelleriensis]
MSLSCFELGERMLSVGEARAALDGLFATPLETQQVPLEALLGRVLAEPLVSPIDVPQNTNAAMDGIALAWPEHPLRRWPVVGDVLAGQRWSQPLAAGTALRITTGAPLPDGADTVIMSEQLAADGDRAVEISRAERVRRGQNVRQAGEDIARGQRVLDAGTRLQPQHLGLLASLGLAGASVHRRPRVAIFSTGDEVTAPGQPLPEAGIYDANRFTLRGMLTRLGVEVVDLGILADCRERVVSALAAAAGDHDMLITSGGVSVGQADWIKAALNELGELGFWRIAIRPGRPLACGRLGPRQVPFFGLPGNPVAVMVTFLEFVQPVLRRLQGEPDWQPPRLTARAEGALDSRLERVDFVRGIYRCDADGQLWVRSTGAQGSGILSSMSAANCLIEIDASRAGVASGEAVTVQPFDSLI